MSHDTSDDDTQSSTKPPLFGSLDPRVSDAPDNDPTYKALAIHKAKSMLIYVGKWFRYSSRDRQSWNHLVEYDVVPEPIVGLGAKHQRMYASLPENVFTSVPKEIKPTVINPDEE